MTITKSIFPAQVTYTFVIRNFGNEPVVATDNAVFTDIRDPVTGAYTVPPGVVTLTVTGTI